MGLDKQTADKRASIIVKDSIQYDYHIILEQDHFNGLAEIVFTLKSKPLEHLPLCFSGQIVQALIVNNIQVDIDRLDNFLWLPKECLQKGKNRLSVFYQSIYNNDEVGFISFRQQNNEQFIFTHFEPYAANLVFPCFDQPNLKAKMKLTVIAPTQWKVLSNQKQQSSQLFERHNYLLPNHSLGNHPEHLVQSFLEKAKDKDSNITSFPFTKVIPTYIYFLGAGNYQQKKSSGSFPMSIYYTTSGASQVLKYSDFILDVTSKCMDFFVTYFGVPYPFTKYDQIFVKDFDTVAMENASIVTFNYPEMIPFEQATQYELYNLAVIVSHELSHHWFGDLVTMDWWDDLWLKQSFAEYVSCYSLEVLKNQFSFQGKTLFESSYAYLRQHTTQGYQEDHRNQATHPIRVPVNNTDVAHSLFDGITYEKSQAVMKQLFQLVGHDKMGLVIKNYFDRFAWSNATINDLFDDLIPYFPSELISISQWQHMWLETSSLNVFQCIWDPSDTSTTSKLIIKQQPFSGLHPDIRFHQIKIGLFNQNGQLISPPSQIIISSTSTEMVIDGSKKIAAILVNYDGNTFAQNIIDPVSLNFFMNNIEKIQDQLTRTCVWLSISSMVKLSLISVSDFVIMVNNKLLYEPFKLIITRLLSALLEYIKYVPIEQQQDLKRKMFQTIYTNLYTIDLQAQRVRILQDALVQYAESSANLLTLKNLFYGEDQLNDRRTLNVTQIWQTVKRLYEWKDLTLEEKEKAYLYASKLDNSSRNLQAKITCDAIIANQLQFEAIYQQLLSPQTSIREKRLKAEGWNNKCHSELLAKYKDNYFKKIVQLSTKLSYNNFLFLYNQLQPIDSDLQDTRNRYANVLAQLREEDNQEEHIKNMTKITDDLTMKLEGRLANAETNAALAQRRAIDRAEYIKKQSIVYHFHVCFEEGGNYYKGFAEMSFNLLSVPHLLPLDFITEQVYGVTINGVMTRSGRNGQFLLLSGQYLQLGVNRISIQYRNKYNNDGLGCMSYFQTVFQPSKQYVYTKFQPYGAHRFVPCFDQPDLKAFAIFYVVIPSQWKAIGNESIRVDSPYFKSTYKAYYNKPMNSNLFESYASSIVSTIDKPLKLNIFTMTWLLPTYLYCLVLGQYYEIKLKPQLKVRDIQMNLYCIQSYSKNLDGLSQFIFQMTILSLLFYEEKFDVDYQFSKYDSVFCHEFKSGAMESPGVITFNDTYLYPEKVSIQKMLVFASTIVHENSHNWFGNYVTMKWWDDLWLNQSFADLMAYYCLENIKDKVTTIDKYDSGWKAFLVRGVSGYREDQITQTTHAVRSEVANTSVAQTYFDRITYQKGSATLKQLLFLMGQDNFFKGVHDYFVAFDWNNGTIDDFLSKMQKYFDPKQQLDFTLAKWKQSWLLNPSLNLISIDWNPNDTSTTATLSIKQEYYTELYKFLRYHKTKAAFFKEDLTFDIQEILINPVQITKITYDGSKKYKAILMNAQYWSYYKYTIDDVSQQFLKANINKITDSFTRLIIWHDLNESVRDANSKLYPFVNYLLQNIFLEQDDKIFQFQLAFLSELCNYVDMNKRKDLKTIIFDKVYQQLKSFGGLGDAVNRVIMLKDMMVPFAVSDSQVNKMQLWREGSNDDLTAFPITVTQAWQVIKLIFSSSFYESTVKWQLYEDQATTSPGIKAQLTKNTCNLLVADDALMQSTFNEFQQMNLSLDVKKSLVDGWNRPVHLDLLSTYYNKLYFLLMPQLSRTLLANHFQFFYENLKPIDDLLQQSINGYKTIQLVGDSMIGHRKKLLQIKYNYELRLKLYDFNK